jgi:hypothetical protein
MPIAIVLWRKNVNKAKLLTRHKSKKLAKMPYRQQVQAGALASPVMAP